QVPRCVSQRLTTSTIPSTHTGMLTASRISPSMRSAASRSPNPAEVAPRRVAWFGAMYPHPGGGGPPGQVRGGGGAADHDGGDPASSGGGGGGGPGWAPGGGGGPAIGSDAQERT